MRRRLAMGSRPVLDVSPTVSKGKEEDVKVNVVDRGKWRYMEAETVSENKDGFKYIYVLSKIICTSALTVG
jgi:hypothetical protein